jgi:hypothetical protein
VKCSNWGVTQLNDVGLGEEVEPIHHRASIAGYITDAVTQQAISGVEVELAGQKLRPQDTKKVKTREDGFFYFPDLLEGEYQLTGLVPEEMRSRYGGAEATDKKPREPTFTVPEISVQYEADGRPIFDPNANRKLSPTKLVGQVTSQDSDKPIFQAIVKLRGSEIQTLTDKEGNYLLSDLQAGKPTVQISAKGFAAITKPVTLIAGQETKLEKVNLVPSQTS